MSDVSLELRRQIAKHRGKVGANRIPIMPVRGDVLTVNDARMMKGLEPVEGGDVPFNVKVIERPQEIAPVDILDYLETPGFVEIPPTPKIEFNPILGSDEHMTELHKGGMISDKTMLEHVGMVQDSICEAMKVPKEMLQGEEYGRSTMEEAIRTTMYHQKLQESNEEAAKLHVPLQSSFMGSTMQEALDELQEAIEAPEEALVELAEPLGDKRISKLVVRRKLLYGVMTSLISLEGIWMVVGQESINWIALLVGLPILGFLYLALVRTEQEIREKENGRQTDTEL